jgi:REP element-mobilizing transposase RayT
LQSIFRQSADRFGTRIVQLAVLKDHIHLLAEAPDHVALAKAMKGLCVRLGIHLNRLLMESGRRAMGDRYHARLLRTPTEVRHAAHYICNNFRKHEAQRGRVLAPDFVDPYSSEGHFVDGVLPASLYLIRRSLGPPDESALRASGIL